jgi:hypothetical protein
MAQVSRTARVVTLGILAAVSDFMFIVVLRDYNSNAARFTVCIIGCHTNVEALAFFGVIGLLTTLGFVGTILGEQR